MILGIGVDIIEVERVGGAMARKGFPERLFTQAEQAYIADKGMQSAAGFYAAKEAVSKALGTGFAAGVTFKDIELSHDEYGRPVVCLHNGAKARMEEMGGVKLHVSISHIKQTAVAEAILEG